MLPRTNSRMHRFPAVIPFLIFALLYHLTLLTVASDTVLGHEKLQNENHALTQSKPTLAPQSFNFDNATQSEEFQLQHRPYRQSSSIRSASRARQSNRNGRGDARSTTTRQPNIEDSQSTDCAAKRTEILRRQGSNTERDRMKQTMTTTMSYHKLTPRINANKSDIDESLNGPQGFDHEHVPVCTKDGLYEPIQCHRIGYCWCVNRYGQAIKNSATMHLQRPECEASLYESSTDGPFVITGVSSHNLNKMLIDKSASSGDNKTSDTEASDMSENERKQLEKSPDGEFARRVSASIEPSLSLVPNDCSLSREKARERAKKHSDDNIWVPDCDAEQPKLYASKQCHKAKICWCVDQVTGLPMRTSEQLSKQTDINCTDIRKIAEPSLGVEAPISNVKPSFFHGFSSYCDAYQRYEFVSSLVVQFKRQFSEHIKFNPTQLTQLESITNDPLKPTEEQVSRWLFTVMDTNTDGKLNDREWSRFKVNFKLVDRLDDAHPQNLKVDSASQNPLIMPIYILRSQRRCWRDFLEFCGNGDLLNEVSISLSKWLSCTELPPPALRDERLRVQDSTDIHAHSKAAAIARSKYRNPFLGILKPD